MSVHEESWFNLSKTKILQFSVFRLAKAVLGLKNHQALSKKAPKIGTSFAREKSLGDFCPIPNFRVTARPEKGEMDIGRIEAKIAGMLVVLSSASQILLIC
jgi:hypothetical protein